MSADSSVVWRKSTYSSGDGNCLEIAVTAAESVYVRDSKHPNSYVLNFSRESWTSFTSALREGEIRA
ncbi:DUF397 domain-containing protein [Cryptosporangium minutisporangium]|uniref:DUF397 domain-containing protein n=1 Tax=Cryptosporangium minutisporangium TaxID=113569 RepID=A0ABP6SYL7_9ACTN